MSSETPEPTRSLTRRALLGCAAAYGVAGPLLVACSSGGGTPQGNAGTGGSSTVAKDPGTVAGAALVAAADVPVKGGVLLSDIQVVVTQPQAGQFKAFTAVCTHQGGILDSFQDNVMTCPRHGSQFSAEDGSVLQGPAGSPVKSIPVTVVKGQVVRA